MPSFKIVAYNKSKKIGVKGSNLDDIIRSATAKLELDRNEEYKVFITFLLHFINLKIKLYIQNILI